jgi:hypothetical protein
MAIQSNSENLFSNNWCGLLLYCVLFAAIFSVDLIICGAIPSASSILFLVSIPLTSILLGHVCYKILSIDESGLLTVELYFMTGFWLISVIEVLFRFCLPKFPSMLVLYVIISATVFCIYLFRKKTFFTIEITRSSLALLIIIGVAGSLWSQTGIVQHIVSENEIIFLPWADHFSHAELIQRLFENSFLGSEQEYWIFSDLPAPLYHYASYIFSSLLRSVSDLPCINISTAFWLPLGLLISGIGAFVFGDLMWGKKEGILCALAIILLPDPHLLACGSGYFSYHFLSQAGPAHCYANGVCGVGLGLMAQGMSKSQSRVILFGLIMMCSSLLFKAHVFVVVFPASFFWLILSLPFLSNRSKILAISGSAIFLGIAALFAWRVAYISLGVPFVMEFFEQIFSKGDIRTTIFFYLGSTSYKLIVGTLMIWFGAFGPILGFSVILIGYLVKIRQYNFRDAVPFLFLLLWTFYLLLLPENQLFGHSDEYHHRPFHVVYYFLVLWLIGRSSNWFLERSCWLARTFRYGNRNGELMLWIISLILLIIPLKLGKNVLNVGAWTITDSLQHFYIDTGLWNAAKFIQLHGKLGDIFLDSSYDGFVNVIGGVGERRPFLSLDNMKGISENNPLFTFIQKRLEVHNALKECVSLECVDNISGKNNLRWYILHPYDKAPWFADAKIRPVFESNGYRVFDLANPQWETR